MQFRMISVVVLFREARQFAASCLQSLRDCAATLDRCGGGAEYILIDDASAPDRAIVPQLLEFRAAVAPACVEVIRFNQQMHYAHGLAYGLSLARGERVLFVSHDMMLAPACVEELVGCMDGDPGIGVVRPVSQHMDWARSFIVGPASRLRSAAELANFSNAVRQDNGGTFVDWPMLIGDAMLVSRLALDKVGVFDTRFYGFMADVDFGLRVNRAGLRHGIARGAWLHHEGNGTSKELAGSGGPPVEEAGRRMVEEVRVAYEKFRQKWDPSLPLQFKELRRAHFEHLLKVPPLAGGEYQPPLELTDQIAQRM
jgi:O-antigen biosynthesis protein